MSSLTYDLTLAGLSVGSAAALTGIGLIVTYRATGVLNDDWRDGTLTFQVKPGSVHDLAGNPVEASNLITMAFDR